MMTAREELASILAGGVPATASSARLGTPLDEVRVDVTGVGRLEVPVRAAQGRRLVGLGTPAPYGRGEETLTDPEVRDTWQIPLDLVQVDWGRQLDLLLTEARTALGLPPGSSLSAELHSMLVYERGQFFAAHQDSEKTDAMVASLVLMLPSVHTGGDLVVHGEGGAAATYTGSRTEPTAVVFYADRRHEVRPVRTGYRITLTYNLLISGEPDEESPGREAVDGAALLLTRHFATAPPRRWPEDTTTPPTRLVYLLDHEYTVRGLSWSRLKGVDGERARLLRAAADRTGADVALALVDIHEVRNAEFSGWGGYDAPYELAEDGYDEDSGEGGYDQPDPGADADAGELLDSEVAVTHWRYPVDHPIEPVTLGIDEDELCASTPNERLRPTAEEFEGYMGNYGNTIDRWYKRAALIVWPSSLTFAVRAEVSPSWALNDLAARAGSEELNAGVHADVASVAAFWPAAVRWSAQPDVLFGEALTTASRLESDADAALLVDPFGIECVRAEHAAALIDCARRHGDGWMRERLVRWFEEGPWGEPARVREDAWHAGLPDVCRSLQPVPDAVEQLLTLAWRRYERRLESAVNLPRQSAVAHGLATLGPRLAVLLESVAVIGAAALRDTVIAGCRRAELIDCLIPAVRIAASWPQDVRVRSGAAELAGYAVTVLREQLSRPVRDHDDWAIDPPPGCDCELCERLGSFLRRGDEQRLEWPLATPGRRHIHSRIDAAELPVTHETRRTGRPYTLVLTKTRALFEHEDQARKDATRRLDELTTAWPG